MSEKEPKMESVSNDVEKDKNFDRKWFIEQIRKELNDGLAQLTKAEEEILSDNLEEAWQTMDKVAQYSSGAKGRAEQFVTKLRLEDADKKGKIF